MAGLGVEVVASLLLAALLAGLIDAVVGGGGLIQLPALLLGLPQSTSVATISGTNKLSSVMGTAMATGTYLRKVQVKARTALLLIIGAYAGSTAGAQLVRFMPREAFTPLVFVVVVGVGWYTWRRPELGLHHDERAPGRRGDALTLLIGLGVGVWDGFIGPGTGTMFMILLVGFLGFGFLHAAAYARLANLTTNIAAIVVLGLHGDILWLLGALMGLCNLTGAFIGARLALRHGNAFVRRIFLVVIVVLSLRLGWETLTLLT